MKFRKSLLTIFTTLFLAIATLGIVACTGKTAYFKVSLDYDESKGKVTVSDPEAEEGYVEGESVTLTVTAGTGYAVGAVTVNEAAVTLTGGIYTFAVEKDTTVKVTFTSTTPDDTDDDTDDDDDKKETVTVTVTEGTGGSVSLSPAGTKNGNAYTFDKDTDITATVTPDANYTVSTFKVNGEEKALTEGKYTFKASANTSIEATFASTAPSTPVGDPIDASFQGMYTLMDGSATPARLTIQANAVYLGGTSLTYSFTKTADTTTFTVTYNNKDYDIAFPYEPALKDICVTWTPSDGYSVSHYFVKTSALQGITPSLTMHGTYYFVADRAEAWEGTDADKSEFIVSANGITWGSHTIALIAEEDTGSYIVLDNALYQIIASQGEPIMVMSVLENEYISLMFNPASYYVMPNSYVGTWENLDSEADVKTIKIEKDSDDNVTVTIGTTAITDTSYDGGILFEYNGVHYILSLHDPLDCILDWTNHDIKVGPDSDGPTTESPLVGTFMLSTYTLNPIAVANLTDKTYTATIGGDEATLEIDIDGAVTLSGHTVEIIDYVLQDMGVEVMRTLWFVLDGKLSSAIVSEDEDDTITFTFELNEEDVTFTYTPKQGGDGGEDGPTDEHKLDIGSTKMENNVVYYFTAPEDGEYTFTKDSYDTLYWYPADKTKTDAEVLMDEYTSSAALMLKQGEKIAIYLYYGDGGSLTITKTGDYNAPGTGGGEGEIDPNDPYSAIYGTWHVDKLGEGNADVTEFRIVSRNEVYIDGKSATVSDWKIDSNGDIHFSYGGEDYTYHADSDSLICEIWEYNYERQ